VTTVAARKSLVVSGAISGLRAWVAYWIVESVFWVLLPWFQTSSYEYRPAHPLFAVVALIAYIIFGAVLGALIALCLGAEFSGAPEKSPQLIGSLSLVLAFIILLPLTGEILQAIVAISVLGVGVLSLGRVRWGTSQRLIANPWLVPLVLLACPFSMTQFESRPVAGYAIWASALAAAVLVSFFADRPYRGNSARLSWALSIWLGAIVVLLGFHIFLKEKPILANLPSLNATQSRTARLPNVILITIDTVRADHLSLYGYARDTSPVLKEFAQHATLFTNAISAGDMTLSSHASMFTGLYASQHGAHWQLGKVKEGVAMGDEFGLPLPEDRLTLATLLLKKGYRTDAIVANTVYLQHAFHLDQGFQYYDQAHPVLFFDRRDHFYLRTQLARILGYFSPRAMSDLAYVRAGEVNRRAFERLAKTKLDDRPLFLFLNYMDAHQPYFPPAPYDVKYPGKDKTFTAARGRTIEFQALSKAQPYTERDRRRDHSQYDGGIAYLDAQLGELFLKMKELGLYNNSLIIVTSDHGQSFGEKGLVAHGTSVYQEQVHVPLIIKFPGANDAEIREDLASHVDFLPTVLDTLGFPSPPSLSGRSLRMAPRFPVTVVSESFPCDLFANLHPRFRRTERAAFSGSFKLVISTNGKREFYDLSKDPYELHNLYAAGLPMAERLEDGLRRWISALPTVHFHPTMLDKEGAARLKSLGYLQ
jgi:arylsulfatase A-like enzyme